MRTAIVIIILTGAAAWAAGPEAASPSSPAVPSPVPASGGEGPAAAPAVVTGGSPPRDTASGAGEVVLLAAGESGCTFEVKIPEPDVYEVEAGGRKYGRFSLPAFLATGDEGAPELLTRYIRIAAPPEADVSVAVERVSFGVRTGVNLYPRPRFEIEERYGEQTLREVFTYDAQAYRGGVYPTAFAALEGQRIVRGYRLLSVAVHPYQYQPAAGMLKLATSVVVRVSFRGGVRRPNDRYPARPAEPGIFGRIMPEVVLNWETASRWPFAGGFSPARDAEIWPSDFADEAALKIIVDSPALYRLGYADLEAAGYPVDALNPSHLRMFTGEAQKLPRDFNYEPPGLTEIPCYVSGEADGRFDPGDYVEFYGHGCDFFEPVTPGENGAQAFSKDRFTRYNVYWLVADTVAGKRFATASAPPAGGTKPAYFWNRVRLEQDVQDIAETKVDVTEEDEYWYWRFYSASPEKSLLPATIAFRDVYTGGPKTYFQMMVREQEGYGSNGPHHTIVYLNYPDNDHIIFEEAGYSANKETVFHRRIPTRLLRDGQNRIYFEETGSRAIERDNIMLDHFEFEYPRRLRAFQDYLYFSNLPGTNDDVLFEVSGFTTGDVVLYDVTQGRRLTGFEMKPDGSEYTLRFTDRIPSGQRWYVAASSAAADREPLDYYLDAGSKLREKDENVDMIVVVYDKFYDNIMPLVNMRRAEGLNVTVARITDVYDEYSWGLYDPGAIRSFVKDFYRKAFYRPEPRLPEYIFLVGDAYIDHRDNLNKLPGHKLWRDFGRNFVPTYYVDSSLGGRSASDNYFAAMSNSGGPDMAVGRIPVPYDDMLDTVVDKILAYKRNPPNGPWNARLIMSADNNDKSEGGGGSGHFTADNEKLEEAYAPRGFEVRKENIEWLNRRFPWENPYSSKGSFDAQSRGERQFNVAKYMKPEFLQTFNGVIMHYAGHGGPQVWAHEDLLVHHKNIPPTDDIYKLQNGLFLPIIIQCSCSTAYFDQWYWQEGDPADYGHSISEWLLWEPREGAVACLGSTRLGTEGGQNSFLQGFYAYTFPNRKAKKTAVTLGEAHFAGKLSAGDETIRINFVLLGDPSMTVATPRPGITLTPNKTKVKRGAKLKVVGTIPQNFNGKAAVQLFDRPYYFHSYDNFKDIFRDRLLAIAEVDVVNGSFEATLVVPTVPLNPEPPSGGGDAGPAEIASSPGGAAEAVGSPVAGAGAAEGAEAPTPAVASPYVEPSLSPVAEDGIIYVKAVAYGTGFRQVYVCDEEVTVNVEGEISSGDVVGPDLGVYLDDYSFRSGDTAGPHPKLLVEVRDESGVLIGRNLEAIGEQEQTFVPLYVTVDSEEPKDLTHYYKPASGDYRAGSAETKISLGEGSHKITVTAYDNLGNKSERTVQCVVSGALALFEVMNCPNPFEGDTYFTFMTSTDVDSVVIKIYTATGRLIQKLESGGFSAGYHQIFWDGRDRDGDAIANGVYFYKIVARAGDEKIVARQKMFKLK